MTLSLTLPDAFLDDLAERVAAKLAERLPVTSAEGFLDVDQAAEYLAAKPSRIYELKAAGKLAHFKDGRRLLFRREDLDAVLERSQEPPA